jgi:CrcB protein
MATERTLDLLAVIAGGAVGATLRHLVGLAVAGRGGTLVANVVGSFLLGALLAGAVAGGRLPGRGRLVLGTGLLSSFTTYSTFAVETATASPSLAVGYVVVTYALGFAGVLAGRAVAGTATLGGGLP